MRYRNDFTEEKVTLLSEFPFAGEMRVKYRKDNPVAIDLEMDEKYRIFESPNSRMMSEFVKPARVFFATHTEI